MSILPLPTELSAAFAALVDLAPDDRPRTLAAWATVDPIQVEDLRSLLRSWEDAGDFLESGPVPAPGKSPEGGLIPGRRLAHLLLEGQIGQGGMGTVYRAYDLVFDRLVAVKVLKPTLQFFESRILAREAVALARLQHPNIATFLEYLHTPTGSCLVMEHVPGETLETRLKSGPLTSAAAFRLAAELLQALGHAHAAGVLHLDLKPANIIFDQRDRMRILDFGLARLVDVGPDGDTPLFGTAGYLAPEALSGGKINVAADIFGVATLLAEAFSGAPVFGGATVNERLNAVREGQLDSKCWGHLTPEVRRWLKPALSLKADDRPADTAAMLTALSALAPEALRDQSGRSLAVVTLRDNADGETMGVAWAALLADELRARGLVLMRKPGPQRAVVDPAAAGRRLGCSRVAVVSFTADRLKVALLETATGRRIMNESMALPAILRGHHLTGIANRVLALVAPVGTGAAAPRSSDSHFGKVAPAALTEYFAGTWLFDSGDKGAHERAVAHFVRAAELAPEFAAPQAQLAAIYALRYPVTTERQDIVRSLTHARRAIKLAPEYAAGWQWRSYGELRLGHYQAGLEAAGCAAALAPDHPMPPYFAGCHHMALGQESAALREYRAAAEKDPTMGWAWLGMGWSLMLLGSLEEAAWAMDRAVALEIPEAIVPTAGVAAFLAEIHLRQGDVAAAWQSGLAALTAVEASDFYYRDTWRAIALKTMGRIALAKDDAAGARSCFERALAQMEGRPRALGTGGLVVQCRAGLARLNGDAAAWREADQLWRQPAGYDFSWLWSATDRLVAEMLTESRVGID